MSNLRRTAWHFRSLQLLALALPGITMIGCASNARENTYGLAPTDAAFVRQTCAQTMGLRPGLGEFDACAQSLADALQRRFDAHRLNETHAACERQGFAQGTPGLAECVVMTAQNESMAHDEASTPAAPVSPPAAAAVTRISFFSMNRLVQDQHEKLACAQLGLDPVTREFSDCVVEIKQAIFTVQNPL